MKIKFNLDYKTVYGEEIVLNVLAANGQDVVSRHAMTTANDGRSWQCSIECETAESEHIDYYYSVERGGNESRHEWLVVPHRLDISASKGAKYLSLIHI